MLQGIDEAAVTFQYGRRTETWQQVNMLLFSAGNSLNPVEYKAVKWLSGWVSFFFFSFNTSPLIVSWKWLMIHFKSVTQKHKNNGLNYK